MLHMISIAYKSFLFFLSFHKYWAAYLFSTLIIIKNVTWAANQHIRMKFEGSCDTEDWSNNTEYSAFKTN